MKGNKIDKNKTTLNQKTVTAKVKNLVRTMYTKQITPF